MRLWFLFCFVFVCLFFFCFFFVKQSSELRLTFLIEWTYYSHLIFEYQLGGGLKKTIGFLLASPADILRRASRVPSPRTSAELKDKFLYHSSPIHRIHKWRTRGKKLVPSHESEALEDKQKLQMKTFSELAEC